MQLQTALLFWQREFFSAVSAIVFFGTTRRANGFHFTKPSRPALPGGSGVVSKLHQEQRPGLCLNRYGFRILCGAPNPEQVAWGDISLPLTGRAIHSLGFHPHRQAGGVQPTVVYPVMGHHSPGGSKTFPGVAVGEDEILGARGDSHPDAVAFPEAIGQTGGWPAQRPIP